MARGASLYVEEAWLTGQVATANGNSATLEGYGQASTLRLLLNVTAATGTTPSMTLIVEDTLDGTNWAQIGAFAAKTTAAQEYINITTPFADRLRLRWTITGTTPSFTFTVTVASQTPSA